MKKLLGNPNYSTAQQACLSIPTPNSQSTQWGVWHRSLVRCFGRAGANALFVDAWERYGRRNPNAYSTSLAQYLQGQGVNIGTSFGQQASLMGANFIGGVGGFVNAMKYINIAVAGGIAIGFLMLLYNLIVNPDKAKQTLGVITEGAMMVTPQGRALSATKQITAGQ